MIACFAWTNLQIINMSNAVVNLYTDESADLFIRMGPHISEGLVDAVRHSGIFENVYTFDPVVLSYRDMALGWVPGFKVLLLKGEFEKAYHHLLESLCGPRKYTRALVTWFYGENVFVLNYWKKYSDHFAITLVEEGTGSYFYTKKDLSFPMFMGKHLKDRIRRKLTEGPYARALAKDIDTICLYKPECCRSDVDYRKQCLPEISNDSNVRIWNLLRSATGHLQQEHLARYDQSKAVYFSLFTQEGPSYDARSMEILGILADSFESRDVVAKIHTGNPEHAQAFAREMEDRIYADREVYIFEGLYAGTSGWNEKLLVSCISSAAINPKFMFGDEPYVIFTYRLYDDYRRRPIEGNDWVANALVSAYTNKSRVMIPNSMAEFRDMLQRVRQGTV